jgi:hypothetical protein
VKANFFQRFGLFSEEEFLEPQACVELREELRRLRHGAQPVSHGKRFTVVTWFH